LLIDAGANIKFIQVQLGHASIQTTLDTYGHILPSTSNSVGDKLDALLATPKAIAKETHTLLSV